MGWAAKRIALPIVSHRRRTVSASKPSEGILAYASLDRIDYAGGFVAGTAEAGEHPAEAWLREVVESMPTPLRLLVVSGWLMLGARLGPRPSADHILGWPIESREQDKIRLRTDWRAGLSANLVLVAGPTAITFATLVEHRNVMSRVVWAFLVPIHVVIIRYALARAVRNPPDDSA